MKRVRPGLHEIVPLSREELELKANMGQTLMKDYMDILSENGVLETHARCVRCNQARLGG